MNKRIKAIAVLATAAATGLTVTACGSSDSDSSGGSGGGKTLIVGVDQPFTGSSKDAADSIWNAMQLYLKQNPKAGDYTIELKKFDDATAAAGKWDAAQCSKNANDAVATKNLVAVMGTYNSGCAEVEVPILNQAPDGPLLEVSEANTYPGLTKAWDTGEPDKFYPTGIKSYARVVATDDYQGVAGAQMAVQDLKVTNCLVLDDAEVYGKGVAGQFAKEAKSEGIKVTQQAWDGKAANYNALFNKAKSDGVDCVYFGGIEDNNGAQLIKDKVKILGDNSKVKVITPDGFVGYPDFDALPEAEGVYQTFPGLGLDDLAKTETTGKFLTDYEAEYGGPPASPYALYGVQALQVIMQGIEKSDGTRKGVNAAVVGDDADISIAAADAILGKDIKIDPASGDVNQIDITIQQVKGGKETTVKPWPVS
ncbi:branched-chain amino acid ABC transporter substrate-binding protein [Nocardioides sp. Kera G14]|uniref:branched-chain amino acid ABC transporter substrate-binding protein n=1 Tax=Nocardioides sp. Kera G14 TaxID=2884264 RepID=UPI001D0F62E6|nr:branched-chain amino acid ABC transporter substrate-binding protein [Nocardioides sp. Kera G14]UDY22436.1 branched-chain amino acid ABC transporter substrate-binding protein [Nocardioides sp. Kera G14]